MRTRVALAVAAVVLGGCARNGAAVSVAEYEKRRAALSVVDDFNLLLLEGGLSVQLLPRGEELTVKEAERLLAELRLRASSASAYGPQRVAETLLREVLGSKESVKREELNRRLRRFEGRAVLTPEGFMSWALTGEPVEWMGRVEVVGGKGRVRGYEVGLLYAPGGVGGWKEVEWVEEGTEERTVAQGADSTR